MSPFQMLIHILYVGMLYGFQIFALGFVANVLLCYITSSFPKEETFKSLHDKYLKEIRGKSDDKVKKLSEEMFEKIKILMKDPYFEINKPDEHGILPLNYVFCSHYSTNMVKYMIKLCADVELPNKKGMTNLHLATSLGNTELVQLLIDNGVDINTTWVINMTNEYKEVDALIIAINTPLSNIMQQCKMISFLFEHGAKIDEELMKKYNNNGVAMWLVTRHLATDKNMREHYSLILDTIDLFLQNGLNINEVNMIGQTGLIVLAKQSNFNKVRLYLDLGANSEQKDNTEKSALDYATDILVVKLLMATINKKMENRLTTLEKDILELSSKVSMSVIEC
jgi:ankyrin repeat protein